MGFGIAYWEDVATGITDMYYMGMAWRWQELLLGWYEGHGHWVKVRETGGSTPHLWLSRLEDVTCNVMRRCAILHALHY